jgi:hypothetical protein
VVKLGGADRPSGGRVEKDEVGVATDGDCALPCQTEPRGRCGGEKIDHPLERDAAARNPFAVKEREKRLDAGRAVADLVERDASGRFGLLDTDAVGDVVGRDDVE